MAKLLYLLTIYFIIGLSIAHQNQKSNLPWYYNWFRPLFTPTTVCTTNDTQVKYLTKVLTLISTLQNNATYNSTLQLQSANFLAYVRNPVNQGLLFTNCSNFVTGLVAAKTADITAARNRQRVSQDICRRIRQIPRDVVGSNGTNDMDIGGSHECPF